MKRSVVMILIAVGWIWLGVPLTTQSGEMFTARLALVPITGAQRADVAGKGSATGSLSGRTLSITGSFEGLVTPATAARLHRGVAKGARGPAISDLTVAKATSGTISGSVALTADDVEALRRGRLYVQVSSEKGADPDGSNLWGWLLKQ